MLGIKLKNKKPDYSKLYIKVNSQMIIIIAISIIGTILFRQLTHGKLAKPIAIFFQYIFDVDYETSLKMYGYVIRSNIEIFYIIAVVICFLALSHYLFMRFTKYFNEINNGIDILINGEDTEIELSQEINFMANKLNGLKQTLEKREQNAKLAEQRKNDVVMYLAHDIKTPLTSVIGYLSLINETTDMPIEQKAKYVSITLDKAYRLEQLIDEFFDITRYNLQAITLTKTNIDLYYMLIQIADEFYPQLATKGKKAVVHSPEDLTVYGDPDKLARVFNNILKNATAYSEDNSVIDITATCTESTVSVMFKNVGTIAEDRLSSIFDKFYRLDEARSSDKGGAGLGLAIAKEIIDLHEGKIYAESNDNYTVFTITLPVN